MARILTSLSISPKKLRASTVSNSRSKLKLITVAIIAFANLACLNTTVNCRLNKRLEEHYDRDHNELNPPSRLINDTPHRSQLEIDILNYYHFDNNTRSLLSVLAEDGDTGNIFEIPTDTGIVSVECSSHEPVTWDFEGYLQNPDVIRSVVLKRISSHLQNEAGYLYTAVIHIDASSSTHFGGSGYYICSHLNSPARYTSKSLYLYGRSDLPKTLLQPIDSQRLEIIPVSSIQVVLPCRASHPNVSVQLMKQNQEGRYDTLTSNKFNVAYDAKQGFTITSRNVSLGDINSEKGLYGVYKCSLSNTDKETPNNLQLFIAVVSEDLSHVKKPNRSSELKINLVQRDDSPNGYNNIQSFHCLSHESDYEERSLSMSVVKCNNAVHCKFITKILETRLDQHDIYLLHAHETNSLIIPETYMSGVVICTLKKMKYQYVQFYRSVNSYENKILLYPENTNIPFDDKEKDLEATSIIDPAATMQMVVFPVSKTVRLKQAAMTIRCTLSSFPFARGSKFLLEYSNGSVVSPHILVQTEKFYTNMMSELEAVVSNRPENISKIKCLAPLWNSNKWANQTFPVRSPKIFNASAKSLTFCEGDTDQNVFCEAEGSPTVAVAWYKDGRPYDDPTQNSQGFYRVFENSTRYTLHFNYVSHIGMNIAGVYTCIAKSLVGTASHQVTIHVESHC